MKQLAEDVRWAWRDSDLICS